MVVEAHRRVIAIDGPAGAGKSTIAKALSARLHMKYLDTGAMYRAVTFEAMLREMDLSDQEAITQLAQECDLHVGIDRVIINGHDATTAIRGPEVTGSVSKVAANSGVRTEMRIRQQEWASAHGGGVIEGRDIATVVFPEAILKVFLTASPAVRAQRRVAQSGGDVVVIEEQIRQRDHLDSTRADSPLRESNDSLFIDTTDLSIDAVVNQITSTVESIESNNHE